ncbi:MAG: stage III sporulation protein AE, partial [Oscillospiraceae bacterium]|nr:stage III sporulation protein AE [Oscillospiraceae bacterium]
RQVLQYGKLLLPVMTAALSAQGGVTSASGLYLGTAFFGTLLGSILSELFIPLVYFQLALSMGLCASQESLLKKIRDMLKGVISWTLKTMLTVFTTYMGITGAVSGNVDKAAVKAAKLGISSAVPVVGGVLSEASEMILVSAGILKNTAGIYGIFALLSLFLEPFLRIGLQYLILKISAMICSVIGTKQLSDLVEDFAAAMGILLGITASAVLLSLISTVCFMNGVK